MIKQWINFLEQGEEDVEDAVDAQLSNLATELNDGNTFSVFEPDNAGAIIKALDSGYSVKLVPDEEPGPEMWLLPLSAVQEADIDYKVLEDDEIAPTSGQSDTGPYLLYFDMMTMTVNKSGVEQVLRDQAESLGD